MGRNSVYELNVKVINKKKFYTFLYQVFQLKWLLFINITVQLDRNWTDFKSLFIFFFHEWSIASVTQQLLNLTADQSFRNHRRLFWCFLMEELSLVVGSCCCGLQARVTAGQEADTHSGTRWRSPRSPWPRVCPGKKGDISGSRPPLYGAGRRRATSPAPPRSTRWRGRCTCTWRRQRRFMGKSHYRQATHQGEWKGAASFSISRA